MNAQTLNDILIKNPVVAAVREARFVAIAAKAKPKVVFLLSGKLSTLTAQCSALKKAGKVVFIHVDLIEGLRSDKEGLAYIANVVQPDGIITTKNAMIRFAHELGLLTIQRVFLLDSSAIVTGANNSNTTAPDFVEALPGTSAKALSLFASKIHVPLIAGGLLLDKEDIYAALGADAIAVSTTSETLWAL